MLAALGAYITGAWLFQLQFMWRYVGYESTDLAIFRQAAESILQGERLYLLRFGDVGGWTWPPFGALAVLPTLLVPVSALLPLAYVINAALLAVIIGLCGRPLLERPSDRIGRGLVLVALVLAAAPLTPVADTAGLGQIGLVLMLLVVLDLLVVAPRAPAWHGLLIGIATAVKVTPGLFIVHLATTRQWRAAITAAGTTLACWTLAALILREDSRDYWGGLLLLRVNDRVEGFGSWVYNQSWLGLVDGLAPPWPAALWAALSAATLVVALRAASHAHRRRNSVLVLGLVGMAGVLVTPIAWHHHAVWVVPSILAVVGDGRTSWRVWSAALIAMVLMVPSRLPLLPPDIHVVAYLALLVCMLIIAEPRRRAQSRDDAPTERAR